MTLDNVEDIFPLSPVQEGMLFHTIAEPGSGVYVQQVCLTLQGTLDSATFESAWQDVVQQHSVLRTVFLWDGLDEPLQVVRGQVQVSWRQLDWAHCDSIDQQAELSALLRQDRRRGFDLAHAPVTRMHLIHTAPNEWIWIWSFHHILSDGWSVPIVLRDLFASYAARIRKNSVEFQKAPNYQDFIRWRSTLDQSETEQFWRRQLSGFDSPTRISGIRVTAGSNTPAGTLQREVELSQHDSGELRNLARHCNVTLNTVIQVAWGLLLSRYSGHSDVVFGVTMSGRPIELNHVDQAVGLYINTLPVRFQLSQDDLLDAVLRQAQAQMLLIMEHEFSSLADVQKWSDISGGLRLFDSILVFENYPATDYTPAQSVGLHIRDVQHFEQSNFPLALLVIPGEQIRFLLIHESKIVPAPVAERMLGHLSSLLHSFTKDYAAPLRAISMLSPAERALHQRSESKDPRHPEIRRVHELIEKQAAHSPDHLAVTSNEQMLTYGELDEQANRIARTLQSLGIGPGSLVGLYIPRCVEMVVGILGILKAGAAYVPLDPDYPEDRTTLILNSAGIPFALHHSTNTPPGRTGNCRWLNIDDIVKDAAISVAPVSCEAGSEGIAYVIHTSGSTGQPRGVLVSHRSLVHSTQARIEYYSSSPKRFLLMSSIAFDSSVAGLFWTLCTGGCLVLPAARQEQDILSLSRLLAEQRVTHTLLLPSLYRVLIQESDPDTLQTLQTVIVAGEACPAELCRLHFDAVPKSKLYNEYGPTEATVWSTVAQLERSDALDSVSIGRPIPGTAVRVLDGCQQPVGIGIPGELYISGPGVASGYLNQPELTQRQFVVLPGDESSGNRSYRTGDRVCFRPDGELLFLGRVDRQIKIRGFRIEPGEIEEHLSQHKAVRTAVVRVVEQVNRTADEEIARLAERLQQLPPAQAEEMLQELESEVLL